MTEQRTRPIPWRLAAACALASAVLAVAATFAHAMYRQAAKDAGQPVSRVAVTASLAGGVAWVWPQSNGPLAAPGTSAPYREAAVLLDALVLRAHGVERGGRTAPLQLAGGTRVVPVLHIESAADAPDTFTPTQREAILSAVRRHTEFAARAGLLQIDFEAPARQRTAYRDLIASVRRQLPAGVRLSVTALAHWCTQGDWLDTLPVDEVVPMLYRLGPRADHWRSAFMQPDNPALARHCRGPALGFATNDPPPAALLARATRPYWFDESAWSNPSRPPRHLVP